MSMFLNRLRAEHQRATNSGEACRLTVMLTNGPAVGGELVEITNELAVLRAADGRVAVVRTDMIISYVLK